MQYDFNTVPNFVIKEASSGSVDIIDHGDRFQLYNNGDRWMVYNKNKDTEIKQFYSSYDLAYGDVLISGLGFGILALWLCNKPEVKSVTVVEISEDVISLFKQSNAIPDKLKIINANMITYTTDQKYDVLLLDHYERQNVDWILKDIEKICNRISHKYVWAWALESIYLLKMYTDNIPEQKLDPDEIFKKFGDDVTEHWNRFIDKFLPKELILKDLPNEKLKYYINIYFNRHFES